MSSGKDRYEAGRWLAGRFAAGKWRGVGSPLSDDLHMVAGQLYQDGTRAAMLYQDGTRAGQHYQDGTRAGAVI